MTDEVLQAFLVDLFAAKCRDGGVAPTEQAFERFALRIGENVSRRTPTARSCRPTCCLPAYQVLYRRHFQLRDGTVGPESVRGESAGLARST
jgi:hypothetical protein